VDIAPYNSRGTQSVNVWLFIITSSLSLFFLYSAGRVQCWAFAIALLTK